MNYLYKYFVFISLFFLSCKKDEFQMGVSPTQRIVKQINQLRDELTDAPYGWRMIYFPKTDSLLYGEKNAVYHSLYRFDKDFGVGGFYYLMKFGKNGIVQTKVVQDKVAELYESEFEVKQGTFAQLSFTTTSHLHRFVNNEYEGVSDFSFIRKDFNGNLHFSKLSSTEKARDYVVFEKLTAATNWHSDESTLDNAQLAHNNRVYFELMSNPRLIIKVGSKEYFSSNQTSRNTSKRYHLFKYNQNPQEYTLTRHRINVLGSGYVGSEQGLVFRPGIRYSNTIVFYDFKREHDYFVSELVRVYDANKRTYIHMAKHIAQQHNHSYEDLYYRAEIRN